MNILKELNFNNNKPALFSVHKSDGINIVAIGLKENQTVSKHKTSLPTLLTVLKGKISFSIEGETFELFEFDTYHIPVQIEHELTGLEMENMVQLVQEKK
jgi:phage shock protein E